MVGEFGEVSVIDWGMSSSKGSDFRKQDTSDALYMFSGSLYRAPEHIEGTFRQPSSASDVYAIGAILYEALTGTPPYFRDSLQESLEAMKKGELEPPEVKSPEAGIDPVLSKLCTQSLNPDPEFRPHMTDFADTLGRFLRREREWEVIRFGRDGIPIDPDDWKTLKGEWIFKSGEFISNDRSESILIWDKPTPGSYRFICEGWIEKSGEISLIGNGPTLGDSDREIYKGYCFQFGAEGNTCTKLARHGEDVLSRPGFTVEPGKKVRIEIEYDEGWLHCYLDNKRIFTYRELFPFIGKNLGLYGYQMGGHFRPIEIRRQTWGLTLPAMQVANDLFQHRYYEAALERYMEISEAKHHRLEADEALLKAGLCYQRKGKHEQARELFSSVKGSVLEPFAQAQEALLDFEYLKTSKPERGIKSFRNILDTYPTHQVTAVLLEKAHKTLMNRNPFKPGIPQQKDIDLKTELFRIGRDTLNPPVQSQIECHTHATSYMIWGGQWKKALDETIEFKERLLPLQYTLKSFMEVYALSLLSNGREDLFDIDPFIHPGWSYPPSLTWFDNALFHLVVRKIGTQRFIKRISSGRAGLQNTFAINDAILKCYLAGSNIKAAKRYFTEVVFPDFKLETNLYNAYRGIFLAGVSMAASHNEELLNMVIDPVESFIKEKEHRSETINAGFAILRARLFLEQGDIKKAAQTLEGVPIPLSKRHYSLESGIILQTMFSSLDLIQSPTIKDLTRLQKEYLAGPDLDLCKMIMGKKKPKPGPLWPHPQWRPELRLYLALWLEAKGKKDEARKIVTPSIDPRYGLIHSQMGINALLKRIGN
jgi:tetratricopeptide (TPR) repeat protein